MPIARSGLLSGWRTGGIGACDQPKGRASKYGPNSVPIQCMNTCTRTGRFRLFGYTNDTGIGGGLRSGITSTSVPSAIADDSPAYTGA